MSLTAFKNKSVIQYGSRRSGIPPGGVWLPQGPFGHATSVLKKAIQNYGAVGFSLNGGHRNIGGVGTEMKMSKSGTPFRGVYAIGWGGTKGTYPSGTLVGSNNNSTGVVANFGNTGLVVDPLLNVRVVDTLGSQYRYIKPTVLTTYGMLQKKYKWAYYGQYPNYWVQPNYTGNQTDTASQWLYIQNKGAANTCNLKVNSKGLYETNYANHGPTLCATSTSRLKYNDMVRNAPYTKILRQPVDSSTYTQYIQRGCQNPIGPQKPFPYKVQTGSSIRGTGTTITNAGGGCNTQPIFLTPPRWYTQDSSIQQIQDVIPQRIPFTV